MTISLENDIIDTMKTIMIAFLVLCFTATVGNTNEKTTLNDISNEFIKQKNLLVAHISTVKEDTIEFQKKNWQDGKDQIARNINIIKSWFIKE